MPVDVTLTAIIVSYNTEHLLRECIGRLLAASQAMPIKIVVVDNASSDNSVAVLQTEFPQCALIRNDVNVGFGRANNQALPLVEGRYILLLNADAFVSPDTLHKTVVFMDANKQCGILGVKLVGRDGVLQPSARYFPTPWNLFLVRTGLNRIFQATRMMDDMTWDHASVRQCDWVPGCFYVVRKRLIEELGLFDPRYFLYYEEIDHCFAAKKAGWGIVFFPYTTVIHIGGESAKSHGELTRAGRQIEALQLESELLYFRKNHGRATVCIHVLLKALGEVIVALKALLRPNLQDDARSSVRHIALLWTLLHRTQWGTRSTH